MHPRSPARKRALLSAIIAWLVSTAAFIVLFQLPPQRWPDGVVLAATAIGAAATATIVVELARAARLSLDDWTDQRHFRWVAICAVILFAVQFTGISMVIASYAS